MPEVKAMCNKSYNTCTEIYCPLRLRTPGIEESWDIWEMQADEDIGHGRFVEFNNVRDLIRDLHS